MHEYILNKVYSASLEFGENWRRPIVEIVGELYPQMSETDKTEIAIYVAQTRESIEKYFWDRYDYKNDSVNSKLQSMGKQWVKEQYPWMNDDNINHAISQAMYYAWHG